MNMQVVVDANTRLTVAVGRLTPANRHDCRAYRDSGVDRHCDGVTVIADGGYQGDSGGDHAFRAPADGRPLPGCKIQPGTPSQTSSCPRRTRTGTHENLECLAQLPTQRDGVWYATYGVAQMRTSP